MADEKLIGSVPGGFLLKNPAQEDTLGLWQEDTSGCCQCTCDALDEDCWDSIGSCNVTVDGFTVQSRVDHDPRADPPYDPSWYTNEHCIYSEPFGGLYIHDREGKDCTKNNISVEIDNQEVGTGNSPYGRVNFSDDPTDPLRIDDGFCKCEPHNLRPTYPSDCYIEWGLFCSQIGEPYILAEEEDWNKPHWWLRVTVYQKDEWLGEGGVWDGMGRLLVPNPCVNTTYSFSPIKDAWRDYYGVEYTNIPGYGATINGTWPNGSTTINGCNWDAVEITATLYP